MTDAVNSETAAPGGTAARPLTACPDNFQDASKAISCTCTAAATASGLVWGSGTYTSDSRICRAWSIRSYSGPPPSARGPNWPWVDSAT